MEIGTNIGTHGMGAGLLQAMEKLVQPEGKPDGKLARRSTLWQSCGNDSPCTRSWRLFWTAAWRPG